MMKFKQEILEIKEPNLVNWQNWYKPGPAKEVWYGIQPPWVQQPEGQLQWVRELGQLRLNFLVDFRTVSLENEQKYAWKRHNWAHHAFLFADCRWVSREKQLETSVARTVMHLYTSLVWSRTSGSKAKVTWSCTNACVHVSIQGWWRKGVWPLLQTEFVW